jgi:hypothetical protein
LIVTIEDERMLVRPFTERDGKPEPLTRFTPAGEAVSGEVEVIA